MSLIDYLPGEMIHTSGGEVFRFNSTYKLWHRHGAYEISEVLGVPLYLFALLVNEERLRNSSFSHALFLDIESATIASVSFPFMAGVGFFEGEEFCLQQIFIDRLENERGLLNVLGKILTSRSFLVTYNGSHFDVPFLAARFRRYGLRPVICGLPHLDLHVISRRLWKETLPNCRLRTLEVELLGVAREDDISSSFVPFYYQKFLETGAPQFMEKVFFHNESDVLSLASLVKTMALFLYHPSRMAGYEGTLVALGREFLRLKRAELAVIYLRNALESSKAYEWEAAYWLAQGYKKLGDWAEALKLWRRLMSLDPTRSPAPYVELAKYYERKGKDYAKAVEMIEKAMRNFPSQEGDLMKRWERLKTKWLQACKYDPP